MKNVPDISSCGCAASELVEQAAELKLLTVICERIAQTSLGLRNCSALEVNDEAASWVELP